MQAVQLKMAMAALGLSADELSRAAGVERAAIDDIGGGRTPNAAGIQALNLFLSANGIELIGSDGIRAKEKGSRAFVTVDQLDTANDGGAG